MRGRGKLASTTLSISASRGPQTQEWEASGDTCFKKTKEGESLLKETLTSKRARDAGKTRTGRGSITWGGGRAV